jgi:saccharopine dehydrogenase-like NADP-dependent oxidoreductase
MKRILLFGAGKSATSLISYLIGQTATHDWQLTVADNDLPLAQAKIGSAAGNRVKALALKVENEPEREEQVRQADIVISLLPPALHFLVAASCVKWGKDLLTASYLDDQLRSLEPAIREKGLLFLCEMGLDPGVDHMSAMQLIHKIREDKGRIISFRSHTGGLVAPESDDNPWHYKISWNPRNVVRAGSAGASYKEQGQLITRPYATLFAHCEELSPGTSPKGLGPLAWYPNRDSLSYIPIYGLEEAETFIRTTLRHPDFCRAWSSIVNAGLTDDKQPLSAPHKPPGIASPDPGLPLPLPDHPALTYAAWSAPLLSHIRPDNKALLEFLGLFNEAPIPISARSSADVLQGLLETRLAMRPADKDMIVMLHELEYITPGDDRNNGASSLRHAISSTLVIKGEDHLRTAMAKTVGLPLGIAARLILEGKIRLSGLHIPIIPGIYEPVLKELEELGIRFEEKFS